MMSSGPDDTKDAYHQAAIEAQRAKAHISFREELAPGLMIDADLKDIHIMTHSKYQKVDVFETYFGKVNFIRFAIEIR